MGKRVICPIQILNLQYDAILVANLFREEISCQCIYAEIVRNRYHAVRDVEAYNAPVDIKSQRGGVLAERLCENEIIFSCRKRNI